MSSGKKNSAKSQEKRGFWRCGGKFQKRWFMGGGKLFFDF
jgi:hypothetical protein